MKHNRGFSLVEMILVIAIGGILAGSSVMALNYLKYADVKKSANELNSMMDKVRITTMTKGSTYLYIYLYDNKCYMKMSKDGTDLDGTGSLLANDPGTISIMAVKEGSPLIEKKVDATHTITIGFKRSNGGFLPDLDGTMYDYIQVKGKSSTYKIRMIKLTGKHYIE